jgi:hypothetical protein
MDKKSRNILRAIADGHSCEQILADGTVTFHDIFHAAAEAPTRFWKKPSAGSTHGGRPDGAYPRKRAQRTD